MKKQRARTGVIRRQLGRVDALVWVLMGVGLVTGLLLLLVFAIPPTGKSLSIDNFNADNRMVDILIEPHEHADEVPSWLSAMPATEVEAGDDGRKGEMHQGEQGKANKPAARQAQIAGVLGLLQRSSAGQMASIFGRDSAPGQDASGALGGQIGGGGASGHGVGGLGLVGGGRARGQGGDPMRAPPAIPALTRQVAPAVPGVPARLPELPERSAHHLLPARNKITGLKFRESSGYWANTYVPGAPAIRSLQARLAGFDRKQLPRLDGETPLLDAAARPHRQTFDRPRGSALSLHLHADRRAARGPVRTLIQVGLQGTARYGGRRPEMKIAVVLDWREGTTAAVSASTRALLLALARAREVGDHFTLTVAGRPGSPQGVKVPAKDFRHGPLVLALQRLEATRTPNRTRRLTLTQAVKQASRGLDAADPTAPPSSNLVLLVVTGDLGGELRSLGRLAQVNAAAGIPTSVVGVGHGVNADQLTKLVLVGQGNRRLLTRPSQAADLVDRELSAAASTIARALRLHIRLSPGVKLVDVLGSYPLDRAAARRVRKAEQSIDLRVARNLGLATDRGEDDEGIQIVIPGFHAGDAHVVLLDVVAPGPGPVAEVTVRYKDLVHLRNSVARAQLSLSRGSDRRGPLEQSVHKNLLSYRSSLALGGAGELLSRGQRGRALATLEAWRRALSSLRGGAGLVRDPDVQRDLAMLEEYCTLLRGLRPRSRLEAHLAGSLLYASYLKVVPGRPGADQ